MSAAEVHTEDGPFLCINPICRRRVTLRRGRIRAAYFAHAWGTGNPECDLYAGSVAPLYMPISRTLSTPRSGRQSVISAALLFGGDSPKDFTLSVRLPAADAAKPWSGFVVLHDQGERRVRFEQVNKPIGDVRPRSSYRLECRGEVDNDYRELVGSARLGLADTYNYFPYATHRAALMSPEQPLRCGNAYWILSFKEMPPPPASMAIGVVVDRWFDWYVTRLTLPPHGTFDVHELAAIETWLERRCLPAGNQAVIVEPCPHHFTDSGIPVFPTPTPALLVRFEGGEDLYVECDGSQRGEPSRIVENTVRVEALGIGRWSLYAERVLILTWEVQECPFFMPAPIELSTEDSSVPLFDPDTQNWIADRRTAGNAIRLSIPDPALWGVVRIDDESCQEDLRILPLEFDVRPIRSIDAQNFGRLHLRTETPVQAVQAAATLARLEPTITWLRSIASSPPLNGPIRLRGHPNESAPAWLQRLNATSWSRRMETHVRALERELAEAGVWNVS